jgi:CubicO group peptidase (beta-lactamase class C family)
VRGELAGGDVTSYVIRLQRDQFLFARVIQLGLDLVVTTLHPSGHVLAETDLLTEGPEFISLTSDIAGAYQIDLRPFDPLASRGSYLLQVLKQPSAAQTLPGKVDQLFAELDETWMPGAVVVVLKDGEIVHTNAFGMADLEGKVPLTTTTPINICSIGKQLTAFAIALLADRQQLGLDDDIRDHLPWVPDFGHPITIRHLVHHTSGLREMDDLWSLADRTGVPLPRSDVLWYVQHQQELNFPPGERYLYCNTGYILLGEIIEAVTGSPFIEWMHANVLDPLGMHDTHFYHDVEALPDGFAWSYRLGPNGGIQRYEMFPAWYVAAGNVFTTAEDLERWLLHLEDPSICSHRLIEQMAQGGKLNNGESTSYAFGQDRQTYRGQSVLEHGGGGWGYRSYIMRFPEHRFATIVVSNFVYGKAFTRARQITDLYLSAHLKDAKPDDEYVNRRRAIAIDPDLLDTYAGTYQQSSGATATVTRQGSQLLAQIAGLDRLTLYPDSASSFFIKEADLRVVFDIEGREHAVRLTVLSPADTVTYTRNGGARTDGPDLADYVGRYVSEELDVQHVILLENKRIWVRSPSGARAPCTHVHGDLFRNPYSTMEFDRDERSRVVGYRVSCERSRNIRFHRQ